jgi:ABC-type nitrate/sulfonate/bicarbonate transport system substrate-binding protein
MVGGESRETMKILLRVILVLLGLLTQDSQLAWPQSKSQPINVSYTSEGGAGAALWVAKEAGLFEKYGLDVSLRRLAGSSLVVQAMLAKENSIAQIGGTAIVDARLAGADLVYLASVIDTMVASIYSLPLIAKIEDLKGRKVGVTRFGTITDFFARYALKTKGLVPDRDVGIVQMNNLSNTLSSLKIGAIEAGVITAPVTLQARKLGFRELVDMTKLGGSFPGNGIVTTRDYLRPKENRETLQRFMKGYVEGISVALKNHQQTLKIISQYSRTTDPEILEETYQVIVAKAFLKVPYPSVQGFQTVLDFIGETRDPRAKTIDPNSIIDPIFVKELDESGFIKGLY